MSSKLHGVCKVSAKLYKEHRSVDTRKLFSASRVIDVRNSLPEAVVRSHSIVKI